MYWPTERAWLIPAGWFDFLGTPFSYANQDHSHVSVSRELAGTVGIRNPHSLRFAIGAWVWEGQRNDHVRLLSRAQGGILEYSVSCPGGIPVVAVAAPLFIAVALVGSNYRFRLGSEEDDDELEGSAWTSS